MKRFIAIACLAALAGCAGDTDDAERALQEQREQQAAQNQNLIYAFPDEGQIEVPVSSPIVLRFTTPVVETAPEITLQEVGGDPVTGLSMEWVDNNRGMIVTPGSNLKPMTNYEVLVPAIELEKGTAPSRTITFSTRALSEGPKSQVGGETFEIIRMIPDGEQYQVMDFSSFRLQFSQPLDRSTVKYGNSADSTVQLMGPSGLVDAHVLVSGRYMTIDPKAELTPDADYTLNITTGLASTYGDTLPPGGGFGGSGSTLAVSFPVTPQYTGAPGTGERVSMVQNVADTGEASPLTGKPINLVPMASVLLGEDTATQASGTLAAELAFVPNFPDETPFRVKRGSLIDGASIDVRIGGEVPAGFSSGDVRIEFLSDAIGYLLPNPYSNLIDVPRQVRLFMDVAVSTAIPTASGAITQDLMHIELVGTAIVEDGEMVINAVGVVEPNVLGSERATGLLSFYMRSVDGGQVPSLDDGMPPTLQSWMPGQYSPEMPADEYGDVLSWLQQPGAPIILNFDKALDPESLNQPGALTVTKDGVALDITYKLDGAAVVIQPEGGLQYSTVESNPEYQIQIGSQITDLAGNHFVPETLTFKLPGKVTRREVPRSDGYVEDDVQINSPMLLSTYPGYPCVTDPTDRDLASGFVGRCAGGPGDWPNEDYPLIDYHQDDNLPLMPLPANRPIVVQFTKPIAPSSVQLGGSFNVIRVDEIGEPIDENGNPDPNPSPVPGDLKVEGQRLTFVPDEPWTPGQYYKYVLGSNNNVDLIPGEVQFLGSTEAVCDGTESICCMDGRPLRTQPLGITTRTPIAPFDYDGTFRIVADYIIRNQYFMPDGGGPDLEIFFKAEGPSRNVLQTLRSSPDVDANGNMIHDADAVQGPQQTAVGLNPVYYNTEAPNRILGPNPDGSQPVARYAHQEAVPYITDPDADPAYDPEGLVGLPNSAKILSMNVRGSDLPWMAEGANLGTDDPMVMVSYIYSMAYSIDGANVGCGYEEIYDPVTGDPGYDAEANPFAVMDLMANDLYPKSEPVVCPERKFTYIKTGLNASVTDEYVPGKGIKVEIHPAQSISSSFVTYARSPSFGRAVLALPSGEQIMRMRYAKDDPACVDTPSSRCARTQPITGWIAEGDDGKPTLSAEVDLYIDAPYIGALLNINLVAHRHNLRSYPVTMSLSGPVDFVDDGRMIIEQRNANPIDLDVKLYFAQDPMALPAMGTAAGRIPYRIPENGVFMQLVSEPMKSVE